METEPFPVDELPIWPATWMGLRLFTSPVIPVGDQWMVVPESVGKWLREQATGVRIISE